MDTLFFVLILLSFLALVLGMFKPDLVIRWGDVEKRNRKNVLKFYGLSLIAFFILFGMSIPPSEDVATAGDSVTEEEEKEEEEKEEEEKEEEEKEEEKLFEIYDSDKELLKGNYADFSSEQISRFEEIEDNYKEVDEDLREEVEAEVNRLIKERLVLEKAKAEEEARIKAEKEEEERIKAEKEAKKRAKEEKEKYNTGITTKDIARDKNGLSGSLVKFSGKILQVMSGEQVTQYRMAVNDDYDQVILIEILNDELDTNILEDDYITIEGMSMGNITYTTVLGAEQTVPGIIVDNFYHKK